MWAVLKCERKYRLERGKSESNSGMKKITEQREVKEKTRWKNSAQNQSKSKEGNVGKADWRVRSHGVLREPLTLCLYHYTVKTQSASLIKVSLVT